MCRKSLPNHRDTLAQALGDLLLHPPQCLFRPIAAVEIIGRKQRPQVVRNLFTGYPLDFCEVWGHQATGKSAPSVEGMLHSAAEAGCTHPHAII
jgi:hypothetical protein